MTSPLPFVDIVTSSQQKIAETPIVFVVDHASNHIPSQYENLGLSDEVLDTHIAVDIGAKQMAQHLTDVIGGTAVMAGFSRLLVDPNRELWRENLMPEVSDGVEISGNKNLSVADKEKRLEHFYKPFHASVDAEIRLRKSKGQQLFIVGIHSFTPQMDGFNRPWHIGFMWNKDERLGMALATEFESMGKVVGRNLPYGGDDLFNTMMTHGAANNLPHTQIEVRQDLIASKEGAKNWAELIATALNGLLKNKDRLEQYKS